jgi:Holliday junction resolvase RusA-like endonuclease
MRGSGKNRQKEESIQIAVATVIPIGKPRMTQRDRWKKRPAVLRYHEFKDSLRNQVGHLIPKNVETLSWVAYLPIPKSWSKKRKAEMTGKPHRQKPDRDNIDKAILDTLFEEDSGVAFGHLSKYWDDGKGPRIAFTWKV